VYLRAAIQNSRNLNLRAYGYEYIDFSTRLLFPKTKIKLKGRRFDTVEEIQAEAQMVLNTLTKKHFQDAFKKWQKR
jgi:MoxR-like ATPase